MIFDKELTERVYRRNYLFKLVFNTILKMLSISLCC